MDKGIIDFARGIASRRADGLEHARWRYVHQDQGPEFGVGLEVVDIDIPKAWRRLRDKANKYPHLQGVLTVTSELVLNERCFSLGESQVVLKAWLRSQGHKV